MLLSQMSGMVNGSIVQKRSMKSRPTVLDSKAMVVLRSGNPQFPSKFASLAESHRKDVTTKVVCFIRTRLEPRPAYVSGSQLLWPRISTLSTADHRWHTRGGCCRQRHWTQPLWLCDASTLQRSPSTTEPESVLFVMESPTLTLPARDLSSESGIFVQVFPST